MLIASDGKLIGTDCMLIAPPQQVPTKEEAALGSRTEVHRFVLHEGIAEQINTALKEDGTSRLAHWRAQVI
jgi:kynurenine formamidase